MSLAESTSFRAIRRYLYEDDVDDDFSQLDTSHTSHHDSSQQSDSILDMTKAAAATSMDDQFDYDNAPILSKTAEAELFLLATNFLLCKLVFLFYILLFRDM